MSTSQIAFNPCGSTVAIAAAAVAPLGVQVPQTSDPSGQYRIVNAGSSTVFLGVGATAAAAQANAVAPVAGVPSAAIAVIPGAVEIFSFGESAFFSGLASVASTVYITQGSGV